MASSPRIFTQTFNRRRLTPDLRRRCPLAVHRPSACSGVKALRNTSNARRQAAKLCSRFGPLTPSARAGNLIAGDGTKNGLFRSEQRTVSETQTTITDQLPSQGEKPLNRGKPHTSQVRTRLGRPDPPPPIKGRFHRRSDEFLESIKKGVETPEKGRNAGEKLIPQGQAGGGGIKNQRINPTH